MVFFLDEFQVTVSSLWWLGGKLTSTLLGAFLILKFNLVGAPFGDFIARATSTTSNKRRASQRILRD
jgi:hypothetical protein